MNISLRSITRSVLGGLHSLCYPGPLFDYEHIEWLNKLPPTAKQTVNDFGITRFPPKYTIALDHDHSNFIQYVFGAGELKLFHIGIIASSQKEAEHFLSIKGHIHKSNELPDAIKTRIYNEQFEYLFAL